MASVVMSEVDKFSVRGQNKIIEGDGAHFVPSRNNMKCVDYIGNPICIGDTVQHYTDKNTISVVTELYNEFYIGTKHGGSPWPTRNVLVINKPSKFLDANGEEVSVGDKLRHKTFDNDIIQVTEINNKTKHLKVKPVSGSYWNPDANRGVEWLKEHWMLVRETAQDTWVPRDKNGVELKVGDIVKSINGSTLRYKIDSINIQEKLVGSHCIPNMGPPTMGPNTYKNKPEEVFIKVEEDEMKKDTKWADHARKIVEKKNAAEIPNAIIDAKKAVVEEKLNNNHFARQADDILKDIKEYLDDLNGADALIEARRIKDELRNANLAALQKKQAEVHAYLQKHLPKDEVVVEPTKTLNKWGYMAVCLSVPVVIGLIGSAIYFLG